MYISCCPYELTSITTSRHIIESFFHTPLDNKAMFRFMSHQRRILHSVLQATGASPILPGTTIKLVGGLENNLITSEKQTSCLWCLKLLLVGSR